MSFQLPITQCRRCQCDASVTINISTGGGGALFGAYDPNTEGLIPTDPSVVTYFEQQTPEGAFIMTWKWNPTFQFWA